MTNDVLKDAPSWLNPRLAFFTTVGSRMRGTETAHSDYDYFGVCVEPLYVALGVHGFQQFARQDGERDVSVYGLRRACQLAEKGNPSLVENLYAEHSLTQWFEPAAQEIVMVLRELCKSRKTLANFGGYLRSQAARLERGTHPESKRAELVARHGYDTKFAAHAIRLGLQGIEFAETGKITLPLTDEVKNIVQATIAGENELDDVVGFIHELDDVLSGLISECDWPPVSFGRATDEWLRRTYVAWDRRL